MVRPTERRAATSRAIERHGSRNGRFDPDLLCWPKTCSSTNYPLFRIHSNSDTPPLSATCRSLSRNTTYELTSINSESSVQASFEKNMLMATSNLLSCSASSKRDSLNESSPKGTLKRQSCYTKTRSEEEKNISIKSRSHTYPKNANPRLDKGSSWPWYQRSDESSRIVVMSSPASESLPQFALACNNRSVLTHSATMESTERLAYRRQHQQSRKG